MIADLLRVGPELLVPEGPWMRLVPDAREPAREILRWRAITLGWRPGEEPFEPATPLARVLAEGPIPAGTLAAAATPRGLVARRQVRLLDPSIMPPGPVAHLHVHAGAAQEFESLWAHLAATIPMTLPDSSDLVMAFLARRVLSAAQDPRRPFGVDALARRALEAFATAAPGWRTPPRRSPPTRPRSPGRGPGSGPSGWERLLRRAALHKPGPAAQRPIRTMDDVWANDPLYRGAEWPEGAFLTEALHRAAADPTRRAAQLLAAYLRVRHATYRNILCAVGTVGLSAFTARYRAARAYSRGLESLQPDLAAEATDLDVGSVELRTGPPTRRADVRALLQRTQDGLRKQPRVERGWVFHFGRSARPSPPRGAGRPGPSLRVGARFGDLHRRTAHAARRLGDILESDPRLLLLVRGIDIAGNERTGPLWAVAPAIRDLRRRSRRAAARSGAVPLRALRVTLHVGEDFGTDFCPHEPGIPVEAPHLATGLRAVHEPLRWGLVTRGDRLGHALALGLDPARWAQRHPAAGVRREVRVLDLLWMLETAEDLDVFLGSYRAALEAELLDHLGRMLGAFAPTALDAVLGSPTTGESPAGPGAHALLGRLRTGFVGHRPVALSPVTSPASLVAHLLWPTAATEKRMDEGVRVDQAGDVPLLRALRDAVAGRVARWGLAVELNPSSNLVIGDFDSFADQDLYGLRPAPTEHRAVPIALAADDRLLFATNLEDELAYAWAGRVLDRDLPPTWVQKWLDEASRTSWRMRFTAPESAPANR